MCCDYCLWHDSLIHLDVFARVGGSSLDRNVSTDAMLVLHSGNIIGDNLWLWRADHVVLGPGEPSNFPDISPLYRQTILGECQVQNGLVAHGTNITIVSRTSFFYCVCVDITYS